MAARLPDFYVIGAARSGTTALHVYLQQHPELFMSPRKETNFFAFEGEALDYEGPGCDYVNNSIASLDAYQDLFLEARADQVIGEASPLYLYKEESAERIARRRPDAKIIAILRDPVEQAFSHFLYARRQTIEPLADFFDALCAEEDRLRAHWMPMFQYSSFPLYHQQLEHYYARFPAEQIKIFLYEEFSDELHRVLREIFEFVGVDPDFEADTEYRPNAGGVPKSSFLQDFVMKPHWFSRIVGPLIPEELKRRVRDAVSDRNMERPQLSDLARGRLAERLHPDVRALESLIGRDLSKWLA